MEDSKGLPTSCVKDAAKFCAIGALHKAIGQENINPTFTPEFENAYSALYEALRSIDSRAFIGEYNDTFGHSAVLNLFDKAIEAQSADEQPND